MITSNIDWPTKVMLLYVKNKKNQHFINNTGLQIAKKHRGCIADSGATSADICKEITCCSFLQ